MTGYKGEPEEVTIDDRGTEHYPATSCAREQNAHLQNLRDMFMNSKILRGLGDRILNMIQIYMYM